MGTTHHSPSFQILMNISAMLLAALFKTIRGNGYRQGGVTVHVCNIFTWIMDNGDCSK
jgi:hypothetical protein